MSDAAPHIPPIGEEHIRDVSIAVHNEIRRQDDLARDGEFGGTHILPGGPDDARFRVLTEEVGEVARVLNERDIDDAIRASFATPLPRKEPDIFLDSLIKELVQVAACATAWAAALREGR